MNQTSRWKRARRAGLVRAVVGLAVVSATASANAVTLRYQANQAGDFVLIGNTLGHDCGSGTPAPVVGTVGACGNQTSDETPDVFWRSADSASAAANNGIAVTDARSTAVLAIPAGATITYARLYWSASGTSAAADTSVVLDRAGTGAFSATVTADASATATTTGAEAHDYYQSTADVTALVVANGVGAYRLGGVDALPVVGINDESRFAAWWMVVFYRLASDPPRNLTIFDGFDYIESHTPAISVTVSGFQVPTFGHDAKVAAIAYLGDERGNGDSLSWNGSVVSDAINPATDFFNSSRSYLGAAVSNAGDLPQLTGTGSSMSGIDMDVIDVTSKVSQGQTARR